MRYAPETHQFIADHVKGRTTNDLVNLVNEKFGTDFTESKMRAYKTNHKLKSGTPVGLPAGSPTSLFPEEIKTFINQNYVGIGPKAMAILLNEAFGTDYTRGQLKAYYGNRGINSGVDGQFTPGHEPFNKGMKGTGGWEPTQFKKGNKPANWVPIGSERINGDGYIDVKVQDGTLQKNWKGKHIIVWEQHNGPVPKGHAIIFGDGDRRNFDANNLILVSRKQLSTMNSKGLIQKNADLTRTGVIVADIIMKSSERKRSKKRDVLES